MSPSAFSLKVALVSTGLGRVLRGFESFTESLFHALRRYAPDFDVTVFQGGGLAGERRVTVPNFHRYDVPARWFGYEKGNLLEKRSFALALYPFLRQGRYDIVHYNELVMGSALYHLRRWFGGKFKLLYCRGSSTLPIWYQHRSDFAQMLTGPAYNEAKDFGLVENRLFLIPYGLDTHRFSPKTCLYRTEVRRELGIPNGAKVILTSAMLDRTEKRIDYILRELSSLRKNVWLIAAGQRTNETPLLEEEAENLLPGRWRFISWPPNRVHLLYGAADIFVLGSLIEAFGRVIVEAMLSGLPIIIHNGPVFEWIAQNTSVRLIDMGVDGELSKALREALSIKNYPTSRDEAVRRFSWEALMPQYLKMYKKIATDDC